MCLKIKVTQADGTQISKEKDYSLSILPGWKSGTILTFPKESHESPNTIPGKNKSIQYLIIFSQVMLYSQFNKYHMLVLKGTHLLIIFISQRLLTL